MATMTLSNITATSVTVTITGCTVGNQVAITCRPRDIQSQNPYGPYSITSSTFTRTITGLEPSTAYVVRADISYGGSATWVPPLSQSALSFTTKAQTALPLDISFDESTTDSITIELNNAVVGNTVRIFYRPSNMSDAYTETTDVTVRASTMWVTIGGLEAGTEYVISADANAYGGDASDFTASIYCMTKAVLLPRPSNWSWQSVVASEAKINISASEWNSFCARILAFAKYVGSKDNGDYTYSLNTVYSGDYITATIVNQARSAISIIPGHGTLPSRVSAESYIYASFFNQLKDALNAIP